MLNHCHKSARSTDIVIIILYRDYTVPQLIHISSDITGLRAYLGHSLSIDT